MNCSHTVFTPVRILPKRSKALASPPPEFIAPQDGSEKQICEINAVKRWIERHADLTS